MISLILWRHAKSSWADAGLADHDRPLNRRGKADAPRMARVMEQEQALPRRILCSTALRTRQTLQALLPHLRHDVAIALKRDLYTAGAGDLFDIIRAQAGADPLMVIGHNPTLEDFAGALIAPATLPAKDGRSGFATGALGFISFTTDQWAAIEPGTGTLEKFVRPRDLKSDTES